MSPKVLIVEDQLPLAQAVARLLARYQISSEISGDGMDALKKFSAEPFDLLVLDLHLPKLSGVEVIRKIRSTHLGKNLPIMVMTGVYKGEEYAKKARETLGVKYYLEKPFTQEAFLSAVKESLAGGKAPAAAAPKVAQPAVPPAKEPSPPAGRARPDPDREALPPADAPAVPAAVPRAKTAPRPPAAAPDRQEAAAGPSPSRGPQALAEIQPSKAIRGDLKNRGLDFLLLDARRQRITGVLFIKKDDDDREILFLNGLPLGMRTRKLESSFGCFLFSQGKISLMEYQVYQNQRNGAGSDEIFIKMGCLLPDEYYSQWKRYLEESLIAMFAWRQAEFTFQLWPPLPENTPLPPLNLAHIVHQGYCRHAAEERIAETLERGSGRFLALTPGFYDYQMHLMIETAEAIFIDRIDGAKTLEELLPPDPETAQKIRRSLSAFLSLGMVEWKENPSPAEIEAPFPIRERGVESEPTGEAEAEEEAAAEPVALEEAAPSEGFADLMDDLEDTLGDVVEQMDQAAPAAPSPAPAHEDEQRRREVKLIQFGEEIRRKNYYEILGMTPQNFNFTRLKEEYFRLSKAMSPEHFLTSPGEILQKAEEALSSLATAYNTLSNVVSKEKYDEMLSTQIRAAGVPGTSRKDHDKMQAEVAFQSGLAFMEMNDWDGADKSLAEAAALAPDNAEILAQYAYAIYNRNRKSKAGQKRAQELLAQALKQKPKCAPAIAYRGAMLLEDGKAALAEADFRTLSINPRYRFALKGLKKIENQQQDDKKGIFSRFRK